ncbi:uncharacterized protein B0I36DRAFT_366659 [Microdochium trichocladiopsis]|uniref:Uncharacterized protein n=1 Tax=Microdochium trichocladiopsis TaxID=1682393 RepID=A0A9P8Y0T2_9PEZI|nr:uncharacterized protein B0I36DRAFT_366659 [Microdochium trichocladiopsis]KAH7024742.1 hypothetical protein B0I36DRAFT_366659 [Microdochium trichocladiopsis]
MSSRAHQVTAIGWLLTSFGHTISAKEWQSRKDFKSIGNLAKTCGTVGWYQGSGLFLILALLNYQYSLSPTAIHTSIDKAVIATAVATIWSSALYYYKKGLVPNAVVTSVVGGLQAYSFFLA